MRPTWIFGVLITALGGSAIGIGMPPENVIYGIAGLILVYIGSGLCTGILD